MLTPIFMLCHEGHGRVVDTAQGEAKCCINNETTPKCYKLLKVHVVLAHLSGLLFVVWVISDQFLDARI